MLNILKSYFKMLNPLTLFKIQYIFKDTTSEKIFMEGLFKGIALTIYGLFILSFILKAS